MHQWTIGQVVSGFKLLRIVPLPDLRSTGLEFEHLASGASLLHLQTQDTESCFSVTFPTQVADDTGLPHILEHAVLGGSERFPVREPFFEMIKMSMATFINAMTSQAYTVYPIATNVKKDFFNLAEVYLDAVFFPQIKEETFRREGHHFALENNKDLSSPLKISGIVFNEMKGYYSQPETLMWNMTGRELFANTPIGRDSGGDPDRIPDLTYAQFKNFHQTLYHPSNAKIFIFSDIPTIEHLQFLDPVLSRFKRQPAPIQTQRIQRWSAPRIIDRHYPVGATDSTKDKTFIAISWAVGDALDPDTFVSWWILSHLLLGTEAAPLKKSIIDSKLGADLAFSGARAMAWEMIFGVGIKASEPDRAQAFETLVLATLGELADKPFDDQAVNSAFQQAAYSQLEISGHYSLAMLNLSNKSWPYGQDPITFLRMKEHLARCQARWEADCGLFSRMIRQRLLDNHHRIRASLAPDQQMQAKADEAWKAKMAAKRATFSQEEIAGIANAAAALEAAQGIPNTPEMLATLPQLKTSDLPKRPRQIPTTISSIAGITVLRNDIFANTVNYLSIAVDLAGLPADLYETLPRFSETIYKLGAAGSDYLTISQRRAACTGGIGAWTMPTRHAVDPNNNIRVFRFTLKTLDSQAQPALSLLGDQIFGADPRDKNRMRDVLNQTRAGMRSGLINNSFGTAMRHASKDHSPQSALEYLWNSTDALRRMESLIAEFDTQFDRLAHDILRIRDFLLNRRRWTVSFTGSDSVFAALESTLARWSSQMRDEPIIDIAPPLPPASSTRRQGLAGPLKIAQCLSVMPAPHLNHPDVPLLDLALDLASFDYFLPEIRFKGNAYGAGVGYSDSSCLMASRSYSDPRIVETLDVFEGFRAWVTKTNWTQTEIDRAIIGAAKGIEAALRPEGCTGHALIQHIRGDTNQMRENRYATSLSATPHSVKKALLDHLDRYENQTSVCVASSREKLQAANEVLGEKALAISDILP
jgi:presequence protease